ncbi:hypothetical protein IMZ48_01665 [Candidatus Bathyarchaeota archaeon]|nr:hypothetical protein [Candidatus Bathyarchaeota archaeon]
MMEQGDELLSELAGNSVEMDAMSEIEKEILDMFAKEKAKGEVTEGAIMSEVGVAKGVPEEGKAEGCWPSSNCSRWGACLFLSGNFGRVPFCIWEP